MTNKDQIEQWLREGTITQEQAEKMSVDATEYKKEQGSNKFIIAISTIGSILLGIGVILFIASNWDVIPNILKVFILVGSTFGAYWVGYYFRYQRKNLPRVGDSLIFLGALLFGATILLIAQIYHINADAHTLVLVWIVGVLPFVYGFNSPPIAALVALLFYIWIFQFVFTMFWDVGAGDSFFLPVLYLISGVLLFNIGALHYFSDKLKRVARTYRLAGLKVVMISLFLLSFQLFSGNYLGFNLREEALVSSSFALLFVAFALLAIILAVVSLFFNPTKTNTSNLENIVGIGLVALGLIFFFIPPITNIHVIIFNLILIAIVLTLLYVGYNRGDMTIVNMGMFWLAALVIVRYFDFFWELLPRSLFFIIGGLILVLGGIALERKRRQLKAQFNTPALN